MKSDLQWLTPGMVQKATGSAILRAVEFTPHLIFACEAYAIDTKLRLAHFFAQIGHESGGMHYLREIWGPTPVQKRYEGRKDLGNIQPGDGAKFRGHGLIQVTGRFNHAAARDTLRERFENVPDFEVYPDALELPRWASLSACWYWDSRNLNNWADLDDIDTISDLINRGRKTEEEGDANGFADRLNRLKAAKRALGIT